MKKTLQSRLYGMRLGAKVAVAKLGPDSSKLDTLYNLPKLETWRKEHVPAGTPEFDERVQMYEYVQREVIGDEPIDYLEFGVFKGDSVRAWCGLNKHADSRFVGFDSFEGLPENWRRFDAQMVAAHFDVKGALPDIDDPRVEFVSGWFQDTLGDFLDEFTVRSRLVLHVDSDLYSSALYTLTRCNDILVPGSIVVFDEFSSVLNEFAALRDYCSAYRREYEVIASAYTYYGHLAIRML